MHRPLTRIALSATIGNPAAIAQWFSSKRPDAPPIRVIADPGSRKRALRVGLVAVPCREGESAKDDAERVNQRAYEVAARHADGHRSIVFVRSRAKAEELTSSLRMKGIETLIHHGSLSVEVRTAAEAAMKVDGPKIIVATSTLELGIDIGDLEQVLQLGPVDSISSWLQRIGRSGRSRESTSVGIMYALDPGDLPIALALCDLANESVSEALQPDRCSYRFAFHQTLNFLRERDQVTRSELEDTLAPLGPFDAMALDEWRTLVDEMIDDGFVELVGGSLQLG